MMRPADFSLRPCLWMHVQVDSVHLELRSWRGQSLSRRSLPCPPASAGAPAWAPGIAALSDLAASAQAAPGLRPRSARIVLSDALVRYCLVPSALGIHRRPELEAYARHVFRGEYGAAVESWRIALDGDARGTSVAALVDGALIDALAAACREAGLRLDSIKPHFAATQATWARRLGRHDAWIAVLEPGHLTVALFRDGTWRHLAGMRSAPRHLAPSAQFVTETLDAHALAIPEARAVRVIHLTGAPQELVRLRFDSAWTVDTRVDPHAFAGAAALS